MMVDGNAAAPSPACDTVPAGTSGNGSRSIARSRPQSTHDPPPATAAGQPQPRAATAAVNIRPSTRHSSVPPLRPVSLSPGQPPPRSTHVTLPPPPVSPLAAAGQPQPRGSHRHRGQHVTDPRPGTPGWNLPDWSPLSRDCRPGGGAGPSRVTASDKTSELGRSPSPPW